jgi:hypothetical protein
MVLSQQHRRGYIHLWPCATAWRGKRSRSPFAEKRAVEARADIVRTWSVIPRLAERITVCKVDIFGGRDRTRTGTPVSQKQILSLLCLPFHHAAGAQAFSQRLRTLSDFTPLAPFRGSISDASEIGAPERTATPLSPSAHGPRRSIGRDRTRSDIRFVPGSGSRGASGVPRGGIAPADIKPVPNSADCSYRPPSPPPFPAAKPARALAVEREPLDWKKVQTQVSPPAQLRHRH